MLDKPHWTRSGPLPGGDFQVGELELLKAQLAARYAFLDPITVDRVARAYGTRAERWLAGAEGWQALGRDFGAGLTQAELDYLRSAEWAVSAEDVLWRRTKLGLRLDAEQTAAVEAYFAA